LLAAPEKHWRTGYSAKTPAQRIRDENENMKTPKDTENSNKL
jgi:hypothetical protein